MLHVIVADSRTLRVFEFSGLPRSLTELAVFRNAAAGRHERDLVSDRPGRVVNTAARTRQSYEPRTSAKLHSMQVWLRSIGPALQKLVESGETDGILLVAAPRMLSELRKHLPAALRKRVTKEVPLDVAGEAITRLRQRLQTALRATAASSLRMQPVHRSVSAGGRARA